MATYKQRITPRLDVKVFPGWCLGHVRASFNVPAWDARASYAAEKTRKRHHERAMPNVIVPVWFSHWGVYREGPGEYGHVLLWVPGRGFLSSPSHSKWVNGVEVEWAQWFSSIEAVERVFNAKYRFWSEDMGGVDVVTKISNTPTNTGGIDPFRYDENEDDMKPTVHYRTTNGAEWTRAHPEIGKDLKPGETRIDGKVTVRRGSESTSDPAIGAAWARTHARGVGGEHSRTNRAGYIAIQQEATRLSLELYKG